MSAAGEVHRGGGGDGETAMVKGGDGGSSGGGRGGGNGGRGGYSCLTAAERCAGVGIGGGVKWERGGWFGGGVLSPGGGGGQLLRTAFTP